MRSLSYLSVTATPHGLIFSLYSRTGGRIQDLSLLCQSGWSDIWDDCFHIGNAWYYSQGSSSFLHRPWMQILFTRGICCSQEKTFDTKLNEVWDAVEHIAKDLKQLWNSRDLAQKIKVKKASVVLLYIISNLLTKFRSCLCRGGHVNEYFKSQLTLL